MEKIIVRVPNWIGDAIMCAPAIKELKERLPDSSLTVLGREWVLSVFEANNSVDELMPIRDKKHFTLLIQEGLKLKNYSFDMAFAFTNSISSVIPFFFANIPIRVGYATDLRGFMLTHSYNVPKNKKKVHEVNYYLNLLAKYFNDPGITSENKSLILSPSEKGKEEANKLLANLSVTEKKFVIIINPFASYGRAKKWSGERFAELSKKLIETIPDSVLLIAGAKKDIVEGNHVAGMIGEKAYNIAGQTTLSGLIAVIHRSDLFITNDSGPMHIGAALNRPMIAIFGSTNPITTGPLSKNATVIREQVSCSPCLLRECPGDFMCMELITVEKVFEACLKRLNPL